MFKMGSLNTLKTFCSTTNLKSIREFIKVSLQENRVSDKDQGMIVLAVDEICSNSIIHGNKQNPNSEINVSLDYDNGKVVIDIMDHGTAFDYSSYKEPAINNLVQMRQKGNMGLMLVKKIMDKIEFYSENGKNICRLTKNVPRLA